MTWFPPDIGLLLSQTIPVMVHWLDETEPTKKHECQREVGYRTGTTKILVARFRWYSHIQRGRVLRTSLDIKCATQRTFAHEVDGLCRSSVKLLDLTDKDVLDRCKIDLESYVLPEQRTLHPCGVCNKSMIKIKYMYSMGTKINARSQIS